jgi:hypothetical protein
VRIKGPTDFPEFEGEFIAKSLGDPKGEYTHWTDLALYRKAAGGYVLQIVARSILYHAANGCQKGTEYGISIKLDELANRFLDPTPQPCAICNPPDICDLDEGDDIADITVNAEVDWYRVHECRTVDELLNRLRNKKSTTPNQYGRPAKMLLDRAQEVDPQIREALSRPRRI